MLKNNLFSSKSLAKKEYSTIAWKRVKKTYLGEAFFAPVFRYEDVLRSEDLKLFPALAAVDFFHFPHCI